MPESKNSINVFIQPEEKTTIDVGIHEFAPKEKPDRGVKISIDNPTVHLDLSLPRDVLCEIVEESLLVLERLADEEAKSQD